MHITIATITVITNHLKVEDAALRSSVKPGASAANLTPFFSGSESGATASSPSPAGGMSSARLRSSQCNRTHSKHGPRCGHRHLAQSRCGSKMMVCGPKLTISPGNIRSKVACHHLSATPPHAPLLWRQPQHLHLQEPLKWRSCLLMRGWCCCWWWRCC